MPPSALALVVHRNRRLAQVAILLGVVALAGVVASAGVALADEPDRTQPSPAPPHASTAASAQSQDDIVRHFEYRLLPEDPDHVEATVTFHLPADVDRFGFDPPSQITVVDTNGFEEASDGSYEWDGTTQDPTATIRQPVSTDADEVDGTSYGTGEWAVLDPAWLYPWAGGSFDGDWRQAIAVDGEGIAGEDVAYLGPHEVYSTTVEGEEIRLVMPEASELSAGPEAALAQIENASRRLDVGRRPAVFTGIVAPDEITGIGGGRNHGTDAIYYGDGAVEDSGSVWVHEYVHGRQHNAALTEETRWLTEGTATYYGALVPLHDHQRSFEGFRFEIETFNGQDFSDVVLSDPDTWVGTAVYGKGSRVAAALDREIRIESNGTASLDAVLRAWNQDPDDRFTQADFLDAVEDAAGPDAREFARRMTETSAMPAMWDREAHTEAYGVGFPEMNATARGDPVLRLEGPHREGPVAGPVAPGETVVATVEVTNEGTGTGTYTASIREGADRFAADPIVNESVTLEPGETRTVELRLRPEEVGYRNLWVGGTRASLRVSRPEPANATTLRIEPANPEPGEDVTVTATLRNDGAFARADLHVVGNATAANRTTLLGLGESTNLSVTVGPVEAGTLTVRAGNRTRNVTVAEPSGSALPGFGVPATLLALAGALAALASSRSWRDGG